MPKESWCECEATTRHHYKIVFWRSDESTSVFTCCKAEAWMVVMGMEPEGVSKKGQWRVDGWPVCRITEIK